MLELLGRHIREVQALDDEAKRRWVVRASAVAGAIVVGLWVLHLSSVVTPPAALPKPVAEASPTEVAEPSAVASFWKTLSNGASVVYRSASAAIENVWNDSARLAVSWWSTALAWISSLFQNEPTSFTVEPKGTVFVPVEPETLPATSLSQ